MSQLPLKARHHLGNSAAKADLATVYKHPEDQGRAILDALSHFQSAVSAILGVSDDVGASDPVFVAYEESVRQYLNVGIGFAEEEVSE